MVGPRSSPGELHRIELVDQPARPVVEHVGEPNTVGDAEGQVEIGDAVPAVDGERADDGSGDDAIVLCSEPQHALARSSRCSTVNMRSDPSSESAAPTGYPS